MSSSLGLLTKRQVAALLCRDVRTLERLIADGDVRARKRGRETVVPIEDLATYLAARQRAAEAHPLGDLAAARLAKEQALARIREVEARIAEGGVLQRAEMEFALEDLVARIRAAVVGARRHASELACTCRPRGQVAQRLETVLRQVLADVDTALQDSAYDRLGLLGPAEAAPSRRRARGG